MTREEAINILNRDDDSMRKGYFCINDFLAIEVLKSQEPCEDSISRKKVKQFLYERIDRLNDNELYDIFSRIIDDMYNELPSVQPVAEDSIPISVIENIKAEIKQVVEEEKDESYMWALGLRYSLKIIDKHISGKE